jgi:diguanylate cyclase (GGDEF)-like protein
MADMPTSTDDEKIAHSFLIYLGLFMAVGGVIWGTLSMMSGLVYQSLFPYAYSLITLINFTYLYYSKNFNIVQNVQVTISLLLPFVFQITLGGFITSGGVILWSILTILGGFTFLKKSVTIRWFTSYIFLVIFSGVIDQHITDLGIPVPHVPLSLSVLFFTLNITLISTSIFGLFYYFVYSNKDLQMKLRSLANTDYLTGLPNRRSFFIKAQKEFLRAKRYDRPFSLLMIDIDLFKHINDTYGHAVGDEVLQIFGSFLLEHCREIDILGRYGGEEFIILLPETFTEDIRIRASEIIEYAQKLIIHTPKTNFSFTISIGLTQFKFSDEDLSTILKRADDALYKAKHMGRNQIQELQ